MKNLLFIFIFLSTGLAMAQTTVTLEDQCNCEVLSGTAVTAAGMPTPAGADLGDIYVNTNTGTIYYWNGGSWELTSSDSQQLQAFTFNAVTNELTLTLENGGTRTVNLSDLVGTDDQNLTLAAGNILTLEDGGTVNLTPFLDNTDEQQVTDFTLDDATNELTLTLENGGTETVDFSAILAAADNQALTLAAGNILTLEDGGTVDLTPFLDNTDDQQVTDFTLDNATNELTLTLEDGGTETVDFSAILTAANTDDQNLTLASGNILTLEDGGTVNLTPFLDNTDDQQVTDFTLDNATNELTLTLEDGGTETVDFSAILAAADNQALTLASGNILTLEDGGTVDLTPFLDNTDDQQVTDFTLDDATNELTLTLEDGGTETVDFSAILTAANTDDQALTLASGNILTLEDGGTVNLTPFLDNTDDQQITDFTLDNTTDELTLTLEDGGTETVDFSAILAAADNQALTLASGNILTLEDGGTVDLTPFLDNTDDQQITDFTLDNATNELTLTLEDGGTETVDFSAILAAADNQALSLASGNILTLEDGGTVNLTPFLDNTDDQQVTDFTLDNATNELTLTLEDGGTETVDFSAILTAANTDDQNLTLTGNTLQIEDGNDVDLSGFLDNTDDQNISGSVLTGTDLTIGIENGTNETVDLSSLVGTDDQNITLVGNTLTLEDGGTVDLAPYLDNTDDQAITDFSLNNTTNMITLTLEDGGTQTIDLSGFVSTDDQNIADLGLAGNILTVGIEDGTAQTVDLSALDNAGTDDQALTLAAGNILTLEDGGTVNLTPFLDNTDDQQVTDFTLDNATNELTLTLEDGGTETVDFSTILAVADTNTTNDRLEISGSNLELEDSDGNVLSVSLGALAAATDTDDQALTLASGNILTLEDGGTVNLTPFLDNTDDQQITDFTLDNTTNELTLTLEDGGTETVDFSAILTAANTDDQNLTLTGNTLQIEDGNDVDLSGFLDNTDDQNISGSVLTGTDLTIGIENGTNETVDLSSLVGTDDQNITLVGNTLTLEDGGTVDLAPYLDNTDDQAITDFSLNSTTNVVTLTLEDGGTQTVDLSGFVSTDDQNIADLGLAGNILTVGIEDGTAQTVDLSAFDDAGTDDQDLTLVGNTLTLEDGGTVDLAPYLDNTDDQTVTAFDIDNATNILTITLENGNTRTVDLSVLDNAGTDDQDLTLVGNTLTLEDGGTVDLAPYLDNTDDQAITDFSLNSTTNVITLTLEDGGTQTVDLSGFVSTDDQGLSTDGTAGNISIEDGNSISLNVDDADSDAGNELNTVLGTATGNLEITDNGGTLSTPLISADANNDIAAGTDGALYLNVSSVTISETITDLSDTNDGFVTYVNESGATQKVAKADIADNGDGTYTFTNNDGSDVILDTRASGNPYDNSTSGLAATDTQAALDELSLASTDDQDLTLVGNTLTLEDGGTVDLAPYLDNTDDQAITDFSLDNTTNVITLTLEDGGTQTVDLSGFVSTDDQNIADLGLAGNILTVGIEDGTAQTVDLSALDDAGTDDQNLTGAALNASNVLRIDIENGTSTTVDLSALNNAGTDDQGLTLVGNTLTLEDGGTVDLAPYLDNTDDQTVTAFDIDNATNILTITLEDGNTRTVDLSALDNAGTDDQGLTLVGNTLTLEDGGTVDLAPYLDNTDDQTVTDFTLGAGDILTITLEDGNTRTVDLSSLNDNGTDDQQLTLATNTLTLEDGGDVDLSGYLDDTDEQDLTLTGTDLSIENGNTVDLSGFVSTDDQNISGSGLSGTDLTIGIENGTNETVDLSSLLGTDDQDLTLVGNTLTLEDGGTVDLAPYLDNTDDQAITDFSLNSTTNIITLTLEDGGTQTVDLSGFVSTDDQNIADLGLAGNVLTVGIEDGTAQTVDLSALDDAGTDDQNLTGAALNASNVLRIDIENGTSTTVDLSALNNAGTDDQNITLVGNTLTLEDGGTVDLAPYLDNTDDQAITDFSLNNTTNVITLTLEDGGTQTVDLSGFVSTDDQNIADLGLTGNVLTVGIEDGTAQTVDLSAFDDAGTDDQNLTGAALNASNVLRIDIENGTSTTVDLSALDNTGTDDQDLTLVGNSLTLEDGGTVDLASYLDNTDDQAITDFSLNSTTNIITLTLEDGGTQTVDLSGFVSTDDQNISGSGLSGTDLTIGIENGTNETVDLSSLVGTDDQNITLVGNTLTLEDGGTVDLAPYLDNTDDQTVTDFTLGAGDILTITLEDGNTRTVDLSSLNDNGTDDQQLTLATNTLTLEDGGDVDLSGYLDNTDDQDLTLVGNTLTLEDGGTVDLAPYLDNTDDQAITDFSLNNTTNVVTLTLEDGGTQTVDLSGFVSTDDQNIADLGLAGNILTVGIEDGTAQTVDLSAFDDAGTDDQDLTLVGNTLTLEDGGTVDLAPYLDNTDDQTVTAFDIDNATNILTITLENGNTRTVDLSVLDNAGTDDQDLTLVGNTLTLEDGGTVDLAPYLDNTDDQAITDFSLNSTTNIITLTLEDGGTQTVDLSGFVSTDDQGLSTDGTAGNISIEDGNSISLNVDDADSDAGNELNTALGTATGNLEITDNGGTLSTPLISADANNDIAAGTDGALYLNVSSVTISETITDLSDTNDGFVTYVNESGATQKVAKADIADNGDGTYTFTNNDGSDVILDTRASGNPYDNSTSGLAATDTQAALDELSLASTDDQDLTLVGNTLTLEDGGTVDLAPYLDNTDDQTVTDFTLGAGDILTITLEDGNTRTVDLSSLNDNGTDDQQLTLATNTLTLEDGGDVDLSGYLDDTDEQDLTLTGTDLSIENGNTVDLSGFVSTDDQNISGSGLSGTDLTIGIENGTNETVDLSSLVGTDDQNITLVGNTLTLEDGGTVDLAPYLDNTDDQAITDFSLDNTTNVITLTLEDGGTQTIDLSGFVSTDDQNLTLVSNTLTLEDGGTVDLAPYLDNTDDQTVTAFDIDNATNILTITLENGNTRTVDLSVLDNAGTDDQNISGSGLSGTDLTIGIENGTNETVDLSSLLGTDDQDLTLVGNTLTLEDGGTVDLAPYLDNTDDQAITDFSLNSTTNIITLTLEDGGTQTVDLSGFVSTDDQNIADLGLAGNVLTVGIEDGTAQTVDLSALDDAGTDDQNLTGAALNASNVLRIDIENGTSTTVDLSALNNAGTDDQDLTLVGNTLTLEDGGTVDLAPYLDNTDDQAITDFSLNNTTNIITLTLEDGGTQTIDLSGFVSTDDQNIADLGLAGNVLTVGIEDGTAQTVDLSALDDAGTDDQDLTGAALNASNVLRIDIENGTSTTVDLSALNNAGTDDQDIANLGLAGNILTVGIESGTSQTVDLSALNNSGTDNQNLTGANLNASNILQIDIEDGTSTTVDLSTLNNSGTDNQAITSSIVTANESVNIALERGGSTTIDIRDGDFSDTNEIQDADEVAIDDTAGNFTATNVEDALAELATANDETIYNTDGTLTNDRIMALGGNDFVIGDDASGSTDRISVTSTQTIFNRDTQNVDFIVKGQTAQNLLHVDASADNVGIGLSNPQTTIDVSGDARIRTIPAGADTDQLVTAAANGDIRKINSLKASKVFYPPSIAIDASTNGTFTIDLYAQYIAQFGSPVVSSAGTIPTYNANELDYHVTFADPTVFNTGSMSISAAGVLTYTVIDQPSDYNSLINVVFVVR